MYNLCTQQSNLPLFTIKCRQFLGRFLYNYLQNNVMAHKSSMPLKKQFLSTTRQRKDVIFFPVVLETWHTNDMYIKRLKNSYRSSSSVSPLVFFSWFFFFFAAFLLVLLQMVLTVSMAKKKEKKVFWTVGRMFLYLHTWWSARLEPAYCWGSVSGLMPAAASGDRDGGRVAAASSPPPRGRTSDSPHMSEAPLSLLFSLLLQNKRGDHPPRICALLPEPGSDSDSAAASVFFFCADRVDENMREKVWRK